MVDVFYECVETGCVNIDRGIMCLHGGIIFDKICGAANSEKKHLTSDFV